MGLRFASLGYNEAYATTGRANVKMLAERLGAEVIEETPNFFFFDGQSRWVYRADISLCKKLLPIFGK